jgi:hypothetical protein
MLKEVAAELARPLSLIFRKSFDLGQIPEQWRLADVCPIFKKGSRVDKANYRPVSLTSIPCKLMESVIRDVIMGHMVENGLISRDQHGFVPRKSCTTNLLECLDFITAELAKGGVVYSVYLDFWKAFDTVPHARLLVKLRAYGVCGKTLDWIADFLRNRKQRVVVDGRFSAWTNVTSGVPQGSVLGPLLFVIFINDLPEACGNILKLYADDSKILARISDAADLERLQSDLFRVAEWCDVWQMQLNADKCKVVCFGQKDEPAVPLVLPSRDGSRQELGFSEVERDLGVQVCHDLSWKKQIETAAARANSILGMLRKTFQHNSVELWKKLYVSYVRPHLEFAVPAWNPHKVGLGVLLEKVQRRATKIPKPLRQLSYEERLRRLGLEKLETRRSRGDLIQFFKCFWSFEEVDWHCPLQPLASTRPNLRVETRGGSQRMRRQHFGSRQTNDHMAAVTIRHNFFLNRIVNFWNRLPEEVVGARSVNGFKARLDKWLLEQRATR